MKLVFFALLQRLLTFVVAKLLIALGITFITYTGFSVGLNMIKEYVLSNFNSMPSDVFELLMLAGLGQAIGIIFGAFAFNIAMRSITKLSFIPSGGGK